MSASLCACFETNANSHLQASTQEEGWDMSSLIKSWGTHAYTHTLFFSIRRYQSNTSFFFSFFPKICENSMLAIKPLFLFQPVVPLGQCEICMCTLFYTCNSFSHGARFSKRLLLALSLQAGLYVKHILTRTSSKCEEQVYNIVS